MCRRDVLFVFRQVPFFLFHFCSLDSNSINFRFEAISLIEKRADDAARDEREAGWKRGGNSSNLLTFKILLSENCFPYFFSCIPGVALLLALCAQSHSAYHIVSIENVPKNERNLVVRNWSRRLTPSHPHTLTQYKPRMYSVFSQHQ